MQSSLDAIFTPGVATLKLINFTGQQRDGELVEFHTNVDAASVAVKTESGSYPMQMIVRADGTTDNVAKVLDIPPMGWSDAVIVTAVATQDSSLSVSSKHLENDLISVRFNEHGEITSIFDKTLARELLQPGKSANQLIAFEDKPKAYDAWDIDHYFEDKSWPLSESPAKIEVVETGPYRAALKIERQYARSRVVQVISLQEGQKHIEFDSYIDWQERQTLLKASFPLDLNTSETRAEIQFGHVKRPSLKNTSWDQARFETSMHRWVDMSEADFGAALITDCKYGYDAVEQTLRLTLLKGSNNPDPHADLGEHRFRYAILLHAGEQDISNVVHAAEKFNNPVLVHGSVETADAQSRPLEPEFSFASTDNANITLETIKLSEVGSHVILRLFEHTNRRGTCKLNFGLPVKQVVETDLMERDTGTTYSVSSNTVSLCFRPFEIKTLKVSLPNR